MKKFSVYIIVLALICLIGCSDIPTITPRTYILENSVYSVAPYVFLDGEGNFVFMISTFSSHLPIGTYSVNGDRLILTGSDNEFTYVFSICEDAIVFIENESTSLPNISSIFVFESSSISSSTQ